jgi:hypothetical protein
MEQVLVKKKRKCSFDVHEQLKADPVAWAKLPYVGRQSAYDNDDPGSILELRDCDCCNSTLAIVISGRRVA